MAPQNITNDDQINFFYNIVLNHNVIMKDTDNQDNSNNNNNNYNSSNKLE